MDDGFLPDYYIRKKQRDRTYRVVWNAIAGVLFVLAVIFVGNFLWNSWLMPLKKAGQPAVSKEHADELNQLQTEERISNAIASQEMAGVGDLTGDEEAQAADPQAPATEPGDSPASELALLETDLSEVDYAESFPLVTVALEAGSNGERRSDQPASAAEGGTASEGREPSTESTPVNTGNTDSQQAEKREEPKKDPPKEEPEENPVISNKVYHVYAAEVTSRKEAEDVVKRLADHGYKGTIIEQNPYFLIKVMKTSRGEEARALIDRLKQLGFDPIPTVSNK